MSKYKTSKITNSGQELLLNCLANKAELQFTRIAFGSGEYSTDSGIVAQTALKGEKQSVSISTISVKSSNSVVVSAILSNQGLKTGYRITEIGLFAKDKSNTSAQEVLYAICIAEDGYADYFPEYNGYAPTKLLQDFYIEVADASSTTILVDDSVGVSKAYLEENYYSADEIDNLLEITVRNFGNSIISDIIIPVSGWTQQENNVQLLDDYGYYIDIQVAAATSEQFPSVSLHKSSLEIASKAGLCPTVQALDGKIRFWARNIPTEDMNATVALLIKSGSNNSASGGNTYKLPVATAEKLGGVKIGDGINVTEDGTISSNSSDSATNEEVNEMLDEIFKETD